MNALAPLWQSGLEAKGTRFFPGFDELRGASDDELLAKARAEKWILITNDKDFGEMVYRESCSHCGIVFLRLRDQRSVPKIDVLNRLIKAYADKLTDAFVVVTEAQVRFSGE